MDEMLERVNNLTKEQIENYKKNLMPNIYKRDGWHIKTGKGVWMEDINGRKYIDLTSQFFTNYVGYGNEEIAKVVAEQAQNLTYLGQFTQTNLRYSLAHKIASIAPKNLNRVAFSVGGGPANETAFKIALKNRKGSRNFITLWDAYHGNTFSTIGATFVTTLYGGHTTYPDSWDDVSSPAWNFMSNISNNFIRVPNPYCYRCTFNQKCESCDLMCVEMLRNTIIKGVVGPVAAVVVEPIQSGGGQIPLPKKYLKRVREICDEFGIILIFDEIQTYAKTGKFFAAEYYDVEPDIITFGKGIGGGFSLAGIIIHDKLEGFEEVVEDLHTYTNNQVTMAASLKSIEIIERDNLLDNAANMGRYFVQRFTEMQKEFTEIGDIRAAGLLIGIEMVKDPVTKEPLESSVTEKILSACVSKGLLFQIARENIIKIKPAMTINKSEVDIAMDIFYEAFKEVLR